MARFAATDQTPTEVVHPGLRASGPHHGQVVVLSYH